MANFRVWRGVAALGWGAVCSLAWAAPTAPDAPRVAVSYADTEKFADFGLSRWDRERNQADLTQVLQDLGARVPPSQQLRIRVLDVNLAGELEWMRRAAHDLRVMRNITWPALDFEYQLVVLAEGERVVKSGVARLTDMAYLQDSLFGAAQRAGPLPYERRMVERWFRATVETR